MAPPAAAFTVIPLADVDPDSPVTTGLMDGLRLNDQNLFAQLVGDPVSSPPFTPAAAHDHDGVNSKAVSGANLRFIAATELTAAVVFVDFTGLSGNVDEHYILYGLVVPAAVVQGLLVQFNGLASGYQNTTTPTITQGIEIFGGIANAGIDEFISFKVEVWARNLIQAINILPSARTHSQRINALPTPSVASGGGVGARSNATFPAPNITSLRITTQALGTALGIGSRFALYKLEEN